METGSCVAPKESPVYQQLKLIEERIGELNNTVGNLQSRLAPIISEPRQSEACDSAKPSFESPLEGTLNGIRAGIENEICRLQDIINRLTI